MFTKKGKYRYRLILRFERFSETNLLNTFKRKDTGLESKF